MKLTMLGIALLVLMGTAMCQEPVNHAVSQPVAIQVYATQPSAPAVPAVQQPAAALPYFNFEPMVNVPRVANRYASRLVNQPQLSPKESLVQPTAPDVTPHCGCSR